MRLIWALAIQMFTILEEGNSLISNKYHSYAEITDTLRSFNNTYHNITNLYSIGKSTKGKDIWVLEISSGETRGLARPNVKLIGNIHGNEPIGIEVLLQLANYLVEMYQKDQQITLLLQFARIHLLPSLNPDGYELALTSTSEEDVADCASGPGRTNYNNYDLNRNFPDNFDENIEPFQSETLAVKQWMEKIPFILSASLHGGALVATYPYDNDNSYDHGDKIAHLTPDNDVFKHLASVYASSHPTMHLGKPCPHNNIAFPNGIINGAAWYRIKGGMQDFNYIFYGCMELTFEISCCKFPKASELPQYWEDNKQALLSFMRQVQIGIRGVVKDDTGAPVVNATLYILGRDIAFHTTSNGEFWRLLLPHLYILQVSADGFQTTTLPIKIKEPDPSGQSKFILITLHRLQSNRSWNSPRLWANVISDEVNTTHELSDEFRTQMFVNTTNITFTLISNEHNRSGSQITTHFGWKLIMLLCGALSLFTKINLTKT